MHSYVECNVIDWAPTGARKTFGGRGSHGIACSLGQEEFSIVGPKRGGSGKERELFLYTSKLSPRVWSAFSVKFSSWHVCTALSFFVYFLYVGLVCLSLRPKKAAGVLRSSSSWTLRDIVISLCYITYIYNILCLWVGVHLCPHLQGGFIESCIGWLYHILIYYLKSRHTHTTKFCNTKRLTQRLCRHHF